eukprot:scaffold21901_cov63-Phaeocystis_antarctica.AAC.1
MQWRLQPYAMAAATVCGGGCIRMWQRLQLYLAWGGGTSIWAKGSAAASPSRNESVSSRHTYVYGSSAA